MDAMRVLLKSNDTLISVFFFAFCIWKNWKDAVRNSIQLSFSQGANPIAVPQPQQGGRRNLLSSMGEEADGTPEADSQCINNMNDLNTSLERRLTRSAFTKTLLEREMEMTILQNDGESSILPSGVNAVRHRISVFDIRGLARLRETFSAIDNSVKEVRMEESKEGSNGGINILHPADVSVFVVRMINLSVS